MWIYFYPLCAALTCLIAGLNFQYMEDLPVWFSLAVALLTVLVTDYLAYCCRQQMRFNHACD
jgi:hypothetical protein